MTIQFFIPNSSFFILRSSFFIAFEIACDKPSCSVQRGGGLLGAAVKNAGQANKMMLMAPPHLTPCYETPSPPAVA